MTDINDQLIKANKFFDDLRNNKIKIKQVTTDLGYGVRSVKTVIEKINERNK